MARYNGKIAHALSQALCMPLCPSLLEKQFLFWDTLATALFVMANGVECHHELIGNQVVAGCSSPGLNGFSPFIDFPVSLFVLLKSQLKFCLINRLYVATCTCNIKEIGHQGGQTVETRSNVSLPGAADSKSK